MCFSNRKIACCAILLLSPFLSLSLIHICYAVIVPAADLDDLVQVFIIKAFDIVE